jgi:alpha-glucosidase
VLAEQPHHDGSPLYTAPGHHRVGETVRLWIRVPTAHEAERVRVRSVPDAEPMLTEATVDHARTVDDAVKWWFADVALHNPSTNYRFLLEGGSVGYAWLNGSGLHHREVPDAHDFRITTFGPPPMWLDHTVGYEIFVDRFARSGERRDVPPWAIPEPWDAPIHPDTSISTRQLYGGDLVGIENRLEHLERLGVDLIYLTPFFPSESAHRYDATTFDHVDPLLGGDEALTSLVAAAHERGIRVIGDITLNHTGSSHDWFLRARAGPDAPEADYYLFGATSADYVAWHDVPSLPKLDHRSRGLATRLYDGPDSTIARYLGPDFGLDGWRVDCANTTGRHADVDVNHEVASATRQTVERRVAIDDRPRWLLAEHCYDAGDDLAGDGWHGSMAYQWFTRPMWSWLRGERPFALMSQTELPALDGQTVVASVRELGANVPWTVRRASMTMLDSHDSARFRTVVGGDRTRHLIGLTALMTMPGVPTIFAGSEVGVGGDSMDTGRVPFPWDEDDWDRDTFDAVRTLVELRHDRAALQTGGLRWIDATADAITFVRELPGRAVLVDLRRATGEARDLDDADLTDRTIRTRALLFDTRPHDPARVEDAGLLHLSGSAGASIVALGT